MADVATDVGILRRPAGAIQRAPATRGLYAIVQRARREHRRAPTLRRGWTNRLSDIRHRAATEVPVAAALRGLSVSTDLHGPGLGSRVYVMQEGTQSGHRRSRLPGALPMRDLGRLAAWDEGPDRTLTVRPDPGLRPPPAALFRARCCITIDAARRPSSGRLS